MVVLLLGLLWNNGWNCINDSIITIQEGSSNIFTRINYCVRFFGQNLVFGKFVTLLPWDILGTGNWAARKFELLTMNHSGIAAISTWEVPSNELHCRHPQSANRNYVYCHFLDLRASYFANNYPKSFIMINIIVNVYARLEVIGRQKNSAAFHKTHHILTTASPNSWWKLCPKKRLFPGSILYRMSRTFNSNNPSVYHPYR